MKYINIFLFVYLVQLLLYLSFILRKGICLYRSRSLFRSFVRSRARSLSLVSFIQADAKYNNLTMSNERDPTRFDSF